MPGREELLTDASAARFWSMVDKRGPDECWPWTAYCDPKGYGRFQVVRGIAVRTHRVTFYLTHGRPVAPGMHGCHRCNNPKCCNPVHVYEGTPQQNVKDMFDAGRDRRPRGVAMPNAKLTHAQALAIRSSPASLMMLARLYGVSKKTIIKVKRGESYAQQKAPLHAAP